MAENCTERGYPSDGVIFYATNISLAVVTALICVPIVILNSLVIASVVKTPSLQSSANLLLSGLAASDLLAGLVPLPLYMAARLMMLRGEANNCLADLFWKLYENSLWLSLGTSQVQLCLMGLDRYKAVSKPFIYRATVTKRKTITSIAISWTAWFIVVIITAILIPQPQGKYVQSLPGVFFIVVPLVAQIATYKAIRRHNRQTADVDARTTAVAVAREKAMAVTLRYATGAIFGCLMVPTAAFTVAVLIKNKTYGQCGVPWAIEFSFLSACINPLIYFMRHADIRAATRRLLGW